MIYGYARVSTDGQSVDAQVRQLTDAGCEKIYRETASGAKTDRTQLGRVLAALGPGDVLVVTRLDRLARSTRDLLNTLATITGAGRPGDRAARQLADPRPEGPARRPRPVRPSRARDSRGQPRPARRRRTAARGLAGATRAGRRPRRP